MCAMKFFHGKDWEISEIIPNELYLGSIESATNPDTLNKFNIKSVLSLFKTQVDVPSFIQNKKFICIDDYMTEPIGKYFDECVDFIKNSQKPILVHCEMGMSRSATIVIVYLMSTGMLMKDAYDFVKQKRSFINPNNGFWFQIYQYSMKLYPNDTTATFYVYEKFGTKRSVMRPQYNKDTPVTDEEKTTFVKNFSDCGFLWGKYWQTYGYN
ncbi:protein-tyrosine-phosphatase [Entamoeba marina]